MARLFGPRSQSPPVSLFGLTFPNRLGLAAGYDKAGTCLAGLAALGFGHIEIGTVTPQAQPGNPRPRIFRLEEDQALINRMGFPSAGAGPLRRVLEAGRPEGVVVGVSLGKGVGTPLEEAGRDYVFLLREFAALADYVVLNVSSPNTLGLRRLQARSVLESLLATVADTRQELGGRHPAVLVKLAPELDLGEVDDVVAAAAAHEIDGIIAANTTTDRPALRSRFAGEAGGLSGKPLFRRTLAVIRHLCRASAGRIPIVACGGISTRDDFQAVLDEGASLAQVYTALVYQGPGLVRRLVDEA